MLLERVLIELGIQIVIWYNSCIIYIYIYIYYIHAHKIFYNTYLQICMHTWYSAVPAAPLPQKLCKKDGWLWVVYCPFCFCFSIYCIFFPWCCVIFFQILSEEEFSNCFGMFLLMVLSHLSSLLSVSGIALIWLARMPWVETPKRSWCGAPEKCRIWWLQTDSNAEAVW